MAGRMLTSFAVLLCVLALAADSAPCQTTGSFSGTVVLDKTTPLAGATVMYNRIRDAAKDSSGKFRPSGPVVTGNAVSAADGSFLVEHVPAGRYVVCAAGTQPNHLRSCSWGQASADVQVTSGANAAGLTLNIRTGALITFNVSDAAGRIQVRDPTGARARQTNVGIGVVSRSGHYLANLVGHSGTQWTYAVAVPVSTPVFLWLDSALRLVDQATLSAVAKQSATYSIQAADTSGVTVNLSVQ